MEQFLTEALKSGKGIELGEALSVGGMVTGVGLGIVFGVLIILMIVLMLFKVIFYKDDTKKKTITETAFVENTEEVKKTENTMTNDELIAVLTAAIAASLNTSTYNLRIKSYRRLESNKPAWNRAGINDTINSRY